MVPMGNDPLYQVEFLLFFDICHEFHRIGNSQRGRRYLSYFWLHKLHQINYYVPPKILESHVHAVITSNIDYSNCLYINIPNKTINKLQKIQNSATRLITGLSKYWHITPALQQLHWLPVSKRVKFKVLTIVFKCLNNMAPKYLSNNIKIYTPTRNLRSINKHKIIFTPMWI